MAAAIAIGRADDAGAAASVAAATGGSAMSADTAARAYTTLTGPRLTESDKNGIGAGSIVLVAPPYFEFNPSARVTVAVTGSRRGSDLVLSNSVAAVTKDTITIDVTGTSFPNARRSTLTWSGIQVRPTLGSPLVAGHISRTGTAAFAESGSVGHYGSLATIPGPVSNLMVALPGQAFAAGAGISGSASPQTAGVAFAFASLTAADQHYNVVTSYAGTRAISYFGPGGTPSFTTNVTFSNGQSQTALATILRVAETTTVTASDGTVAGPPSSLLTVRRGPYTRLQVLVPGETPAPGTAAGKSGAPVTQAAGVPFAATARAVDDGWNLIETATDTVSLAATDANAVLAANLALASGTGEFTVDFRTAGIQTLAAASRSTTGVASAASAPIAVNPAAFDRLLTLAPGESALPGTSAGRTGTPSAVVSGSAITVTVHAVDAFWNVVPTADFVGLTASDGQAAMPPGAALINGILAIPVVLKTAGLTTVTASNLSNGAIASGATPPLTVGPGPFTRLQVLAPGETVVPGSPAGKTGVALPQSAGVGFAITVRAADDNWNLVETVTDTVQFASSDGFASLPPTGPLATGSNTLSATLNTVGMQTIAVSDMTDASRLASTSSIIPVGMAELHPASGGGAISADSAGGTYTVLTGPVIMEGAPGNIGAGTIVLSAPPGFDFDPGHAVSVTVSGTGAGTDVVLASPVAAVSPAAVSITVSEASGGSRLSTLTWSGLQVRPASGSPLARGVITNSGSSVLSGIAPDSSFGPLAEVPGVAARLAVDVEPSPLATAGVAFARQPQVRIEDQFGNLRTNDGATVVSAARAAGSGPLRGSLSAIARNGLASFADLLHEVAGTISLAFSAPGLPGATSASPHFSQGPAACGREALWNGNGGEQLPFWSFRPVIDTPPPTPIVFPVPGTAHHGSR